MTSGQTMALEVGCEVLLRVGSATVQSNTSPALIDISTGGTVNSGASLTKNHLYMATIPDPVSYTHLGPRKDILPSLLGAAPEVCSALTDKVR